MKYPLIKEQSELVSVGAFLAYIFVVYGNKDNAVNQKMHSNIFDGRR